MKKNYLFLVAVLSSALTSLAQPVITAAMFQDFSVELYSVPDLTGVTQGPAGASQTWDFSGLVLDAEPALYLQTVPVNTAPYHETFPAANFCQQSTVVFDGVIYRNFSFAKITSSALETLGSSSEEGLGEEYLNTPLTPLPLNYNDSYVDTEQSITDTEVTTSIETYDGYGTLISPFGAYNDVVRIKSVRDSSTSYSWINTNPYSPLMSVSISNLTGLVQNVAVWKNSTGLATNQVVANNSVIVFPNPAQSILNIKVPQKTIDKIRITDLSGKTVIDKNTDTSTLDIENLAAGIYMLQVTSGKQQFETKFVKQ